MLKKVKILLLILSSVLLSQGCSRPHYAFMPANSKSSEASALFPEKDEPEKGLRLYNASAFRTLSGNRTEFTSDNRIKAFRKVPLAIARSNQELTLRFPGNGHAASAELLIDNQPNINVTNALKSRNAPAKVLSRNNLKEQKKGTAFYQKPTKGEGYFKIVFFALLILLPFLLLSNLSGWVVLGIMVGAIAVAVLLTFIIFVNGGFGKIGG